MKFIDIRDTNRKNQSPQAGPVTSGRNRQVDSETVNRHFEVIALGNAMAEIEHEAERRLGGYWGGGHN